VHQLKNSFFLSFSLPPFLPPSLPPSIHQGRDGGRREIEYLNTRTGQPARATVELDCQAEFQREFGAHFAAGTTMPLPWGQMGGVGCCVRVRNAVSYICTAADARVFATGCHCIFDLDATAGRAAAAAGWRVRRGSKGRAAADILLKEL
jgi:hypothetical protein